MNELEERVIRFFTDYRQQLLDSYPGLTSGRILQELESISDGPISVKDFFDKLLKGIPLQYISGKAYFYKWEFVVSSDVLIPRSETELLVEMAVELIGKNNLHSLTDVGVGSGNILLSILLESIKPLQAYGIDISDRALKIAKINYENLKEGIHSDSSVCFLQMDRLKDFKQKVDLVISNPPYIKRSEAGKTVHHQVDRFEPSSALYIDDSEYENWFIQFFEQSLNSLNSSGYLLMEGHEDLLQHKLELAEKVGFVDGKLQRDLTGRDRYLICRK